MSRVEVGYVGVGDRMFFCGERLCSRSTHSKLSTVDDWEIGMSEHGVFTPLPALCLSTIHQEGTKSLASFLHTLGLV